MLTPINKAMVLPGPVLLSGLAEAEVVGELVLGLVVLGLEPAAGAPEDEGLAD
jgi:hypothetical protein